MNPNLKYLIENVPNQRVSLLQGGTRCFVGETLVSTPSGPVPIKDIEIGQTVHTPYGVRKVVNKFTYKGVPTCHKVITFVSEGVTITSTETHEFRTEENYVEANILAKRALERGGWFRREIHGKQFWKASFDGSQVKEPKFWSGRDYQTSFGWFRLPANNVKAERKDKDYKGPQDSSTKLVNESRSQTTSKPQGPQQAEQQGGELGVGYPQGEHRPYGTNGYDGSKQRIKERNEQANRREGPKHKSGIQALRGNGERFSKETRGKYSSSKRSTSWKDLDPRRIEAIYYGEYTGTVYDIEVEQDHCYIANGFVVHNSGKSWNVGEYLYYLCYQYSGIEIDVVRTTYRSVKATWWVDFEKILRRYDAYHQKNHNRSEGYYILNGNKIQYFGADDDEKVHGKTRDILFVNEAQQVREKSIDQLFPRTKYRIICDYNPALGLEHWLDKYIEKYPPCITTYKDNDFLTASQIQDIEDKRDKPYWWKVYGTGERATVEGAVFDNWTRGKFPDHLPVFYGQDYGFTKDPTTLVAVAIEGKKIYLKELLYETGLTTSQIYSSCKKIGNGKVIADSAEPRLIVELKNKGLNIQGAHKTKIVEGIRMMQDYEIVVEGLNLEKEFSNYAWADKKGEVPIDDWNHGIDAARYAIMWKLKNPNHGVYAIG